MNRDLKIGNKYVLKGDIFCQTILEENDYKFTYAGIRVSGNYDEHVFRGIKTNELQVVGDECFDFTEDDAYTWSVKPV